MGFFDWAQNQWNQRHGNQQQQGSVNGQMYPNGYVDPNQQAMYPNGQGYVDPNQQAMYPNGAGYIDPSQQAVGGLGYPYGMAGGYGDVYGAYAGRTVTKKMLLDYIVGSLGACEVVQCEEFETRSTRHICQGSRQISILPVNVFNVPTPNGTVPVEVIWCPNCRKLWVNRSTLEII